MQHGHPLLELAMHSAKHSVAASSQKAYKSAWNKWEKFLTKYIATPMTLRHYQRLQQPQLLRQLLMFVSYCAYELKCNVRSIPGIMSGLRNGMVHRLVPCCAAFDDELLKTVKQGVSRLPAPAHWTRVPCTLEMINHIIILNTAPNASMKQVMLATGISMAFHLCLRSSEYVSRTVVPIEDSHQFLSADVEFMLNDESLRFVASNNIHGLKYQDFKVVNFSMLHAKNIRQDYGVPIWFSTVDAEGKPVPFVHLVYLWSRHSVRNADDPFLSFRHSGELICLLYSDIKTAIKQAAPVFGLNAAWFDTQSIRMSQPSIARAAGLPVSDCMRMGRWKSLPAALLYQEQSTTLNNTILSIVSDPTLFTSEDVVLARLLASRTPSASPRVRRFWRGSKVQDEHV